MYTKDGFHKALEQKLGDDAYLLLANGGHKKLTELLTAASLAADGNNTKLSITVGGTTKTSSVTVPYANAAAKWATARTLTIGSTGKSVNGSTNVSWSLDEIGVYSKTTSDDRFVNVTGDWMNWNAQLSFKGKGESTSVYSRIGYATSASGQTMHCVNNGGHQADGAFYITSNGSTSANDTGGLAIDNEGVTVFGAGDAGSNFTGVFRVLNEDNVADGPQFIVTKASGATTKYSHSAQRFISNIGTGTQPYACSSTTVNTNLNADLLDGIHANGLLTAASLGTSGNTTTLSVTVGGTTKTSSVTVPYASNADKVDGIHANGLLTAASLGASGNSTTISVTVGGTTKTGSVTVPYATNSTSTEYLNNHSTSDPAASKQDLKVKWFASIGSTVGGSAGYAGNNYGFPCSNNANGILWLGTHSGNYGGQLGISSNGSIYYRFISAGSFPTTANGGSWVRLVTSSNYTDYTVTKTGSGASGTWGINVTGSAGSVAWGNVSSKPATATRWPTWAEVTSKPSSTGSGTQPVYWNGSTFVACTTYANASVNYANSAGVATGITNGFKRFEFNAGKTYIGWVSIAKLQLNTSNQYDYNSFNLYICRSYNSPSSESYAINITIGWVKATVRLIGKSVGSQIINKCRIAIDTTNHVLYLQVYVNTAYTTYANSCSATLVGIVNNNWTLVNSVNNSLTNVTELDLTAGIQSDYANSAGNADTVDSLHASDFVRAYGTTNDNIDSDWGQSIKTFDPIPTGTPPEQNPNITLLSLGNNFARRKMLAFTWNNDNIYYRRRQDSSFTGWVKLIHSGNIGSQSVSYASSAGSVAWGNVTGKPSTFTPSAHNHAFIRGSDNRSVNNNPAWYMTNVGSASVYTEFCLSGGAVSSTYENRTTFTPWGDNSGQRPVQLAFNNSGMFMRTSASNTAWNAWNTIIHSGNIGSQSVNYASSAGNADTVDGYHANRFAFTYCSANYGDSSSVSVNDLVTNGVSNASHGMIYAATDNPVGSANWVHVWSQQWNIGTTSSWVSQIALGVQQGNGMWYRTYSGNIVGKGWTRVLDSSNYISYMPRSLPANGGTSSCVTINYNNDSNSTYQMLWGSGNYVYGTGGIYCNPYTDYLYSGSFYCGNWFRSSGATGWYNESYGGGIYMEDTTYVRTYNGKNFYVSSSDTYAIYTAGSFATAKSGGCFAMYNGSSWYTDIFYNHWNGNLSFDAPGGSLFLAYYRGNIYLVGETYYINRSGNVYCNQYYTSSDQTKKTNIESIASIVPIRKFNWKQDGSLSYGFIAQELVELGHEELVHGTEGNMTVNYDAALSLSMAKLSNYVEKLENTVKELKDENNNLKSKIEDLYKLIVK